MHAKDFNVAIVGGGICGVTLAIALLREGIQVEVYESASKLGEKGAGVALGTNSIKTLERLGFLETILSHSGHQPIDQAWKHFSADNLDLLYPEETKGIGQQLPMYRSVYLDALVPLLPKDVTHFNKRCIGVSQFEGEQKYTIHFADGSTVKADVVVGADGIKSTIRHSVIDGISIANTLNVDEAARRRYGGNLSFSGVRTYRGLIPMEVLKAAGLKMDIDRHAYNLFIGKDKHMMAYLLSSGKILNIALSIVDHDALQTIAPPLSTPWIIESTPNEDVVKQFTDWNEDLRTIIRHLGNPNMWAIHHINPPLKHYVRDGVVLLGDAAHASTPFLGAGVSQGLDDIAVLKDLLTHLGTTRSNVQRVLQEYDLIRPPRGANVCQKSYAAGKSYMSYPDIDPEQIKSSTLDEIEKLYKYDLDADIEAAIQRLKADGTFVDA